MLYRICRIRPRCWGLYTVHGTRLEKLNEYASQDRALTAARLLAGSTGRVEIEERPRA